MAKRSSRCCGPSRWNRSPAAATFPDVQARLVDGLRNHPVSRNWLAWDLSTAPPTPIGCAICQIGFSTFLAKPTLNLHDLFVLASHRDRGVGGMLMQSLHRAAEELGCGKVTLEVNRTNEAGQALLPASRLRRRPVDRSRRRRVVLVEADVIDAIARRGRRYQRTRKPPPIHLLDSTE